MSLQVLRPWAQCFWQGVARPAAGLLLSASLFAVNAAAQALPPELAAAWRATKLPESALSLVIQEVGGPRLVAVNPAQARNPASVMKMVTTWAGLSGLGPEYTWRTTLLARGAGQVDAQGTLSGPLYIKAAGDPDLAIKDLWGLLRDLRLRGIKNLSEVVIDRSVFGNVGINTGAFDGAADRPYNASPDAMMVGLGAVRLIFQPDTQAKKWVAIVDPPVPGLRINGDIAWSPASCPGSPGVATQLTATDRELIINVSGTAAGSCGEFSVYRLAQSQPDYFAALFKMLWKEQGGTLAKGIRDGQVPAGVQPIVWHHSDSLANIIRQINKQSNNVMARTLLLTLAAERTGTGATAQTGASTALAILQRQNIDTSGWVIDNGAGLSREARLTAQGLVSMLDVAWHSSLMPEFISSLAISGVDGTVRRRMRNTDAQGMAHLKTGTLRDARALAGYVLGASGKRYILVSMVNDERSVAVRPFDDAVVKWLAGM